MTPISEKEMETIYGGGKTYWYTTSPNCTYATVSPNYFAEPAAFARVVAHKFGCSLCSLEHTTYSRYLPRGKNV